MNRLVGVLCLCAIAHLAAAQSNQSELVNRRMPKPFRQSPNVASLGKFGSYEVNMYNGLPEISIPLYEVKSGSLSVPITLNYHASGVRMFDVASWVGAGFSLSTGGQVARDLKGDPDEYQLYFTPLVAVPNVCTTYEYLRKSSNDIIDTQPDIFSYQYPGKAGTFVIGRQGEDPYLTPYEPIEITHTEPPGSSAFELEWFNIRDEDGVSYKFGQSGAGESAFETTSAHGKGARTAWHLMEMTAPDSDDKIGFNYQSVGTLSKITNSNKVVIVDNCTATGDQGCPYSNTPYAMSDITHVSQKGVSQITFEGGKVVFTLNSAVRLDQLSSDLRSLDKIEVFSEVAGVYTLQKTIKFVYSYFQGTTGSGNYALKLDEVRFIGSDGVIDNRYKFEYHTNYLSWNLGTEYSQDFFGYFNGKPNTTLLPVQTVEYAGPGGTIQNIAIGGADRSTVTTYAKEGVLKKIIFPTGGYTEFDYESHRYQEAGVTKYAGGVRVTSIKSYDGVSATPVTKTYSYGAGGSGFGTMNFINRLKFYTAEYFYIERCPIINSCGIPYGDVSYRVRSFFSNPMMDISAYEGAPVVYTNVTEFYGDPTTNIGKIEYEYDNGIYYGDNLYIIMGPNSGRNYRNTFHWKRGKLTRKTVRDKNGNKLAQTDIAFTLFQEQSRHIGLAAEDVKEYKYSLVSSSCTNEVGIPVDVQEIFFMNYNQSSGALRQTSVTETTYETGAETRSFSTTNSSVYNTTYLQPVSSSASGSTGTEVVVTKTKYPFSYTVPGSPTGTALGIRKLMDKHIYTTPVEEYTLRQNADGSNARVLAGSVTTFKENANNTAQVLPDEVYVLETATTIPGASYTETTTTASALTMDSRYKPRIKFRAYDGKGNITEVQKTDDNITSYVWGYRDALPVAEVSNTDRGELPDTYTDQLYSVSTSYTTTMSSDLAVTPAVVIPYAQTVGYHLNVFQAGGTTPAAQPTLDVVLKNAGGTVVYDPAMHGLGTYQASLTLPAGTYTLHFRGNAQSTPTNTVTIRFVFEIAYQTKTTHVPKIFYTSFEETGVPLAEARSGGKVNSGSYVVSLPSTAGKYWLTWWQKTGAAAWSLQQQLITVPGATTYTVGSGATYVDEVRLYPEKAFMTTYTYDPVLGITTTTDRNNKAAYYRYDPAGRLKSVLDDERKVVKTHQYHYKSQNP